MKKALSFLILAVALRAGAQVNIPPGVVKVGTAPSGACTQGVAGQLVTTTGAVWTCQNITAGTGTWTLLSSGGGGGVTSVSNSDGTLTISPTTGAAIASLALGHANLWTGAQSFTHSIAVGASPPTAACPDGVVTGCWAAGEAATAGTPGAGYDYIRADSTAHTFKFSLNGGAEQSLGTAAFQPSSAFDAAGAAAAAQAAAIASAANANNISSGMVGSGVTYHNQPYLTYDAWGDSITAGAYLSSQVSVYDVLLGKYLGQQNVNDHGIGGATTQINAGPIFAQSTPNTPTALQSIMLGTNDVTVGGNDANQAADFGQGLLQESAWLAIPNSLKVLGTSFTRTGWTAGAFAPGIKTSTLGNTASFTVTGTVVLLSTTMQATSGTGGAASLTCDGNATGATLNFAGIGGTTILAGPQTALAIVTGLTNTTHSCVVTVTSSSGVVDLNWAAGLSGSSQTTFPTLLVGNIIMRNGTDAPSPIYRAYNASTVTTLNGIGLSNVLFVDTSTALTAPQNYSDGLHPNDQGQFLIAGTYITVMNTKLGYSLQPLQFFGAPIYNHALVGSFNMFAGPTLLPNYLTTTGTQNVGYGAQDGFNITTGFANDLYGTTSGGQITTGFEDDFSGSASGGTCTTCSGNSAHGYNSMGSGLNPTNGTAEGIQSLQNNNGAENVGIGDKAGVTGTAITTDSHMAFFGSLSGKNTASILTDSAGIGDSSVVTASHQVVLGASTVTDVYAGSTTGAANLHGNKLLLAAARKGTFTCTGAGTITISNTNEAVTSDVVISMNTAGGTITTPPAMSTVTAGTGFTVLCGATDTSVYNYDILN